MTSEMCMLVRNLTPRGGANVKGFSESFDHELPVAGRHWDLSLWLRFSSLLPFPALLPPPASL